MKSRKKITSFQDLYPTPKKLYGIATRHSEDFGINVPYVTFLAALPPVLILTVTALDTGTAFATKTDIANHSLLFIIVYILAGLFSIIALLGLRSALRELVVNFGFLAFLYIVAFFPACLVVGNIVLTRGITAAVLPPVAVAAISAVIIMFLFSLAASVTNR